MHKSIIKLLSPVILSVLSTLAVAEPSTIKLDDFTHGTMLSTAETEFGRFTLTTRMIKEIQRRDMGDVRVFDEDNELVPIMVRKVDGRIKTSQDKLAFSPHKISGTTSAYILDRTANHKSWLKSVDLGWRKGTAPKILSVRVEHSADRKTWEILKDAEVINNVNFNGLTLEQNVIDIDNHTQRYIKLTFIENKTPLSLLSVIATVANKKPSAVKWIIADTLHPQASMDNAYHFSVGEGVAPNLLKLSFSQLNTVLSGTLYTLSTNNGKPHRKLAINNFNAYKVTLNNKVVKSKPVSIEQWQSSDWYVAADAASNISAENLPDILVSYPQYEIIFANDGDKPYTLVWGYRESGKPVASDIVKRLKAGGKTLRDIDIVTQGRTLNSTELTELMESRQWHWLMMVIALIILAIVLVTGKIGYQRYRHIRKKTDPAV